MAELKTKQTDADVGAFLDRVADPARREDCVTLIGLMKEATKNEPKMWGSSIVGFGKRHYEYASGHEGDTCILGFASRKEALALYLMGGLAPLEKHLARLGRHKTGKGCLYIRRLSDVDLAALRALLKKAASPLRRA